MTAQQLPSGTVTFLLTDIEDSTRLWEEAPDAMERALRRHDEISERTVDAHVEHIRNKLGLRTRAQIAAWVTEQEHAAT